LGLEFLKYQLIDRGVQDEEVYPVFICQTKPRKFLFLPRVNVVACLRLKSVAVQQNGPVNLTPYWSSIKLHAYPSLPENFRSC
jgi:hypothetical protein